MTRRRLVVLRLGHRAARDQRMTTHVCLTARAFGADAVWVTEKDAKLEATVSAVVDRFGGPFEVRTGVPWRSTVTHWQRDGGVVMHLTMYGRAVGEAVADVAGRDVLLVVGGEKVPGDLFGLADHNVAVGNEPHSEVAALAITLDRLTQGGWRAAGAAGRVRIVPNPRGKTIIDEQASKVRRPKGA